MTNPITEARQDVKAALEAVPGLNVYEFVPERITPPVAIVTPDDTYVQPGRVLGEFEVGLRVRLYAKTATNKVVTQALDELIVNVVNALRDFGSVVANAPGVDRESYETAYLVSDLTIKTNYR